jgi:hypothetical protein
MVILKATSLFNRHLIDIYMTRRITQIVKMVKIKILNGRLQIGWDLEKNNVISLNNYYRSLLFKDKPKSEYYFDLEGFRNQWNSIEKIIINLKLFCNFLTC